MFIWFSSNNGRPGFGCCSGIMLLLPLSLCIMSTGSDYGMLMTLMVLSLLAAMFVLPQMTRMAAPVITEKRKNDEYLYPEKPKRLETGYVLTDDGEVVPSDENINRYGNFDGGS
jgi:hypothetical protein